MNQNKPADGKAASRERIVEVGAADLPLHCPLPSQQLWDIPTHACSCRSRKPARRCALTAARDTCCAAP